MQTRYKEDIFYDDGGKMLDMLLREMLDASSLQMFNFMLNWGLTNLIKLMYLFIEGAGLGVL